MKTSFRIAMAMLAGVAIGAIAVQGLHAQGAKLKAYSVSESQVVDASALAAYCCRPQGVTSGSWSQFAHRGRTGCSDGGWTSPQVCGDRRMG